MALGADLARARTEQVNRESTARLAKQQADDAVKAAEKEVKGKDLTWHTPEGIDVPPLYTEADLAGVFSPRTKVVLINDPLNPAASVWPMEDLDLLAAFDFFLAS